MPSRSVFDGRSLTLHRSDGSIVGSWPAISGKNGDQRPSSQNRPFEGAAYRRKVAERRRRFGIL
jgi:hypothetical protein